MMWSQKGRFNALRIPTLGSRVPYLEKVSRNGPQVFLVPGHQHHDGDRHERPCIPFLTL